MLGNDRDESPRPKVITCQIVSQLMDACMNAYRGMLCPKGEVEICTRRGRWDGVSICCHIRKVVGWAALEILRSSVQATLEAVAVTLSLTESCKGVLSWATHLERRSLLLGGACAVRRTQVHWVIGCVCDQWAGTMQGAPSMAGTVSLVVGVHGCCDDNPEDWYECMA